MPVTFPKAFLQCVGGGLYGRLPPRATMSFAGAGDPARPCKGNYKFL